jgi:hypothetical protein
MEYDARRSSPPGPAQIRLGSLVPFDSLCPCSLVYLIRLFVRLVLMGFYQSFMGTNYADVAPY